MYYAPPRRGERGPGPVDKPTSNSICINTMYSNTMNSISIYK